MSGLSSLSTWSVPTRIYESDLRWTVASPHPHTTIASPDSRHDLDHSPISERVPTRDNGVCTYSAGSIIKHTRSLLGLS